jgi:hypothetical protein
MTRKVLIEQIRRMLYGGVPNDDASISEKEINVYINQSLAYMAKINYTDSIKLDGVESVSDVFYLTFKNLPVLKDTDTGYYYATLPQVPVGLARGYGISTVTFPTSTGLAKSPIPISVRELDYIDNLKQPPSKIFYWPEGKKLWFKSYTNLIGKNAIVRMVSTESSTLDDELNVPQEYITDIINLVLNQLKIRKGTPEDIVNDGVDKA